ncbi:hypothetical protein [Butyrivibrio sp.]|uniref:hypothetical protein n=1 Tax=Butyrivibrio sp. TaxID=28121 RepID=UPI0025B9A9E3|nr:hypothetical protein [Butyrivibrio sp.]
MVAFIARMIKKQADISLEKGQAKYAAYFVKTRLYEDYRADVNAILTVDGYEDVILTD